jgi:hypothetical protein
MKKLKILNLAFYGNFKHFWSKKGFLEFLNLKIPETSIIPPNLFW